MSRFEKVTSQIIESVYDNAKGYSLRDKDDQSGTIHSSGPIIKMRLSCRNSESLLLSDEVLESLGTSWEQVEKGIDHWLESNVGHIHYSAMKKFKDGNYDRISHDIKAVRTDLMSIIGNNKPWEVAIGKVIGGLGWNDGTDFDEEGKIMSYLGKIVVENLIPQQDPSTP